MALEGLLRTGNIISSSLFGKAEKCFASKHYRRQEVFTTVGIYQCHLHPGRMITPSQNKLGIKVEDL